MQVGYYGVTKPFVCIFCKGKGCSYCDNQGIKQRKLHLIDETSSMNQFHVQVQSHLKEVKGEVIIDESVGTLEDNSI